MKPAKATYVLDACALLRLAQDEPGAERVADILSEAQSGSHRVLLHQINLGEAVYRIAKQFSWSVAERKYGEIALLPIEIIPFDDDLFWKAVKLKATYPISYADCFAAALALREKAVLLSSDPEFEIRGDAASRIKV
ncbi:type II toxin-antitoxin system VapC family toxin [Methylocaldum szegediense]|jgi:ribonuclease VapC|uniref:Type II toxin-antitoxin system VapC family toxin n=1 Tax=Methylocaldum szegediense TaxID=73780 RepID=A0ABN8XBQ2_9GAMM|nr:type II toxin-antitoxin system VapC family toxin [Methylocaldum szegediense]CAI8960908.1 Type II toxin-antitoxin system VapC family toxin [Methylocaldum szegediense]